ncbi:MAG: redox-regulated ATPase YchF [Patescibacteria group bacterium]
MSLSIAIVGLPNVGKSTLFNALLRSKKALAANYPFATIDPNVGIVEVPDERLQKLSEIVHPQKILPAVVEFHDIAGLVQGASKGEGLGNKFLAHIRECDAILQIVRGFKDDNIIHVHGDVNPKRDIEIIEAELMLADLQTLEKRLDKARSEARTGKKEAIAAAALLEKIEGALNKGVMLNQLELTDEEKLGVRDLHFLTIKPQLYVVNVKEDELQNFPEFIGTHMPGISPSSIVPVCAKIEEELVELPPAEAKELLNAVGIPESGLNSIIRQAYDLLGLMTYFTAGVQEVRAWQVPKGAKAPQAAGVIHTDFEKGFIKAEVVSYKDYIASGGEQQAKEKGLLRLEGKDYTVQDGDVMHFRFSS